MSVPKMKVVVEGNQVVVTLPNGHKVRESSVTAVILAAIWDKLSIEDRNAALIRLMEKRGKRNEG